jgi:hypothetical protein
MTSIASAESRGGGILTGMACLHAAFLLAWPSAPLIAAGIWWNSNTISHNFIHRPFFRSKVMNRVFSAALSVVLGIPQALWRDRHLAHHAGIKCRLRLSPCLALETLLVVTLWIALLSFAPRFFVLTYLPGYVIGLALCAMQGHWEHAGGSPVSHYGRVYNLLCFNDGYHAEHHAMPGVHWKRLPQHRMNGVRASSHIALLRWLTSPLEYLEKIVLHSPRLQRFVLRKHRQAFEALLPNASGIHNITIVGGGLFPRSAIVLRELAPAAHITILDAEPRNLEIARMLLWPGTNCVSAYFTAGERLHCELTVVPLCFDGDRADVYWHPPSPIVLVHDWIWRPRGNSAVVSWLLLKRVNLIHHDRP